MGKKEMPERFLDAKVCMSALSSALELGFPGFEKVRFSVAADGMHHATPKRCHTPALNLAGEPAELRLNELQNPGDIKLCAKCLPHAKMGDVRLGKWADALEAAMDFANLGTDPTIKNVIALKASLRSDFAFLRSREEIQPWFQNLISKAETAIREVEQSDQLKQLFVDFVIEETTPEPTDFSFSPAVAELMSAARKELSENALSGSETCVAHINIAHNAMLELAFSLFGVGEQWIQGPAILHRWIQGRELTPNYLGVPSRRPASSVVLPQPLTPEQIKTAQMLFVNTGSLSVVEACKSTLALG